MGLPSILILFTQKAVTAVKRSQQGIVGIIIRDDTNESIITKVYKSYTEIQESDWTPENYRFLKDCFEFTPAKVKIFRIGTGVKGKMADALKLVAKERVNWLGTPSALQADHDDIVTWIKEQERLGKTYKAVVYKGTNTNNRHVVNFMNEKVKFKDTARGEKNGNEYVPTLLGLLAGLPMTRSATNFLCGNLEDVSIFENIDTVIDNGGFCLIKDEDDVKVARACTSLKDITQDITEDMKDIIIIESMDLITDDIRETFKTWIGKYKNKYDNQVLFFSAVNSYFRQLTREDILDPEYNNRAEVDIESQKLAWLGVGKIEVNEMTDEEIKKLTFKKKVFMLGNIKILNAVEDFEFRVHMF